MPDGRQLYSEIVGPFKAFSSDVFQYLFEQTSQPATILENGIIIEANKASSDLFGLESREHLIGLSPIDVSPERQPNGEPSAELAVMQIQKTFEIGRHELDWECMRKNGERFFIHMILTAIHIGDRTLLYAVYNDISARKRAEMQLLESEGRFRRLFELTRQAVLLVENGYFTMANQASADLLGFESKEKLIGLSPLDISPVVQACGRPSAEMVAEVTQKTFETGSNEVEWECVRVDGRRIFIRLLLTLIQHGDTPIIHSVFSDITEEKKARAKVEYLAYYNDLTGLPNRLKGDEDMTSLILEAHEQQGSLAILLIRLSTFRLVRNQHGGEVCNALQVQSCDRLANCLRSGDRLYHLNSDEFLLVLPDASSAQIEYLCMKVQAHFNEPFLIEGIQVYSPICIGIASYPKDGLDTETLLAHADMALSEILGKSQSGHLLYEQSMGDAQSRYISESNQLQQAVTRQEFTLHYQPKIDLKTGMVSGAEALVRWNHPSKGLLMPAEFIDIAEASGLIVPMSQWILNEACSQAEAWRKAGLGKIPVAVNLSAKHFYQGKVQEDVKAALSETALSPELLELELTESILLENESGIVTLLDYWSSQGIRISIDDFGTGYSSLAYLSRFNLHKLKIDRSFIIEFQANQRGESIVKAILELGKALGLKVISEGVETGDVLERLKAMGCDEAQGYYYAKPMPAEAFETWVRERYSQDSLEILPNC